MQIVFVTEEMFRILAFSLIQAFERPKCVTLHVHGES